MIPEPIRIKYKDIEIQEPFVYNEIFNINAYDVFPEEMKDKVVIDIGANVGSFSFLAEEFGAKKIISIEPDDFNFRLFTENIIKYESKKIEIINKAASNESDKEVFLLEARSTVRTTTEKNTRGVITISLEDLVKQIDINEKLNLKIDCEGDEYKIMLNCDTSILNRFEYIYAEIHNSKEYLPQDLINYLYNLNFELYNVSEFWEGKQLSKNKTYKFKKVEKIIKPEVTCVISTKNRYNTTLPLALLSVCFQTYKPKKIIIFDDGEHKDLRGDNIYSHIFNILDFHKIEWEVVFGEGQGQVLNHIKSIKMAKTPFIWRIDDDNAPEPDVLEKLVNNVTYGVGAVGGLVVDRPQNVPSIASNKIEDIYLGLNEQWFIHPKNSKTKDVDHLYSSFIYKKDLVQYNTNLSVIGHREETMLTYELKRKGYRVVLDPSVITWHFCSPTGGIRDGQKEQLGIRDEGIFVNKLFEWNVKLNDHSFIVLDNGIGDHYAFKSNIEYYLGANKEKKKIIFACYPEVFKDIPDIQFASIADAKILFGNIDKFNLYKWMWDNKWTESIEYAFQKVLNINVRKNKISIDGTGDYVIVSPWSFNKNHPKSYPYWNSLIPKIKSLGFKIIQIGKKDEETIKEIDEFLVDLPFTEIENKVKTCRFWISSDSFLQHLVNCMNPIIKGIVLYGPSDPRIFGYSYNVNILRSREGLRQTQFDTWFNVIKNNDLFCNCEQTFNFIKSFLKI